MRFDSLFRILFILYCVEAGVFLLVAPWGQFWDRGMLQLPFEGWRALLLAPSVRGAVSGFGISHLVWALHDVRAWWIERRAKTPPASTAAWNSPSAPTS
ncbi:MAG: hypothetical protein ABI609_07235 [Acidobacteriota bacterium]